MKVFFYGLFMDASLLDAKGITTMDPETGFVDDYALRIGERATLIRKPGCRAYGVVMEIDAEDVEKLYSEASVSDYIPETVVVETSGGGKVEASCYNLPKDLIAGANVQYADSLLELATGLGFPDSYLDQIRSNST